MTYLWSTSPEGSTVAVVVCVLVHAFPTGALQPFVVPSSHIETYGADSQEAKDLEIFNKYNDMQSLLSFLAVVVKEPEWFRNGKSVLFYQRSPFALPKLEASSKRARFHRYPWKRQNRRHTANTPLGPLCNPTREEIFRLLVAVHDSQSRTGQNKVINFCHRRRPISAILDNIRIIDNKYE